MELVIMAAGMGSRFGGLKQLEPVDENGNFIIDYSIYDAIRCGFNKIVFVIKKENYDIFNSTIGQRIKKKIEIAYIFQENNININRTKPLGTGQAVLLTKNEINDKFAVINADDFYGYDSLKGIADKLKSTNDNFFISIFKLKNTLSDFGKVKRGICTIDNNLLKEIKECEIEHKNNEFFAKDLTTNSFIYANENSPISMNLFGFNKKIFEFLERDFNVFLSDEKNILEKEFFLPTVVAKAITNNECNVEIVTTSSKWLGLTYKEDLKTVKENIKNFIASGFYTNNLWK